MRSKKHKSKNNMASCVSSECFTHFSRNRDAAASKYLTLNSLSSKLCHFVHMRMTLLSSIQKLKWPICALSCIEATFSRLFELYFHLKSYFTRYPKYPKIPGFTRVLNFLVPEYPGTKFYQVPAWYRWRH